MGEGVAGVGIDGAQRRLPGGQMVGMAGADPVPQPLGRLAHDTLGPHEPDLPADVAAQLDARVSRPSG